MAKKYSIIYADPPWRYNQKGVSGAAEKHYPTMSIEELCALPVAEISASDSVLFLWTTFPQLPSALQLIKAWGFSYKTVGFVWLKKNRKSDSWLCGMGFWTRGNAEICLLATKGHPKRKAANVEEIFSAKTPVSCPDNTNYPAEFHGELARIWLKLSHICPETQITAEMLKITSTGRSLKQTISDSQYHFGYVSLKD